MRRTAVGGERRMGSGAGSSLEDRDATMRGDLRQMGLSNIFETLAVNTMEGSLVIHNTLGRRLVFFRGGRVRDLGPEREASWHLGQLLLRNELITRAQLDEVLDEREHKEAPIGALLVDRGYIDSAALAKTVRYQAAEELYALFAVRSGSFEFYRGPCVDPAIHGRLELVPEFNINGVLLEVARRTDDWKLILGSVAGTGEIFLRSSGGASVEFSEEQRLVFGAVDGERSVSDLMRVAPFGVFDTCRIVMELHDKGAVEHASFEHMIAQAKRRQSRGDKTRAVAALTAITSRPDFPDVTTVVEVAELLVEYGEHGLAASYVVRAACACEDRDQALGLARMARRMNPRSVPTLSFLRELLVDGDEDELIAITHELLCEQTNQGEHEAALSTVADLEELVPDDVTVLTQKALLLSELSREPAAVDVLHEVAAILEENGGDRRLPQTYEQILAISPGDLAVAERLSQLGAKTRVRRIRLLLGVGTIVTGLVVWASGGHPADVVAPGGGSQNERARIETREREEIESDLEAAGHRFDRREFSAALAGYHELLQDDNARVAARRALDTRMRALLGELVSTAETSAQRVPGSAAARSDADAARILKVLARDFAPDKRAKATALLALRADNRFTNLVAAQTRDDLVMAALKVESSFTTAEARQLEYTTLRQEYLVDRLAAMAGKHTDQHRFREAIAAHQRLARVRGGDAEKLDSQREVARLSELVEALDALKSATERGDVDAARVRLLALRQKYPPRALDADAMLPLPVITVPPGATVKMDGESIGKTPLLASYLAGQRTRVSIELQGFETASVSVTGLDVEVVAKSLVRVPDWVRRVGGSVDQAALCDRRSAYVVDRSGSLTRVNLENGQRRWKVQAGSLSGLLPTPVIYGTKVILASFDGPLRCLASLDGRELWRQMGLSCQSGPVLVGSTVVVATVVGRAVGFDVWTGKRLFSFDLPGPARVDLRALQETFVVATSNGFVLRIGVAGGKVWDRRVGEKIVTAPVVVGDRIVLMVGGDLVALNGEDGTEAWRVELGDVAFGPTISGSRVLVPVRNTLRSFDFASGRPGPVHRGSRPFATVAVGLGTRVVVGNDAGQVWVLDGEELSPLYMIRGGSLPTMITGAPRGQIVIGYGNGSVHGVWGPW